MKNIYATIFLAAFMVSCGGDSKKSVDDVIAEGDLKALRTMREEVSKQHDILGADLGKLDEAIKKLDTVENRVLVTALKAKDTLFNHYIELQGNVSTKENLMINAEYSGTLQRVYVNEGQKVGRGQVLARIDDGGLGAQLSQLRAQASLAKTTFERQKRLWEQNIGSEMQYLESQTQYESTKNAVVQLERQLVKTTVIAPFSGTIEEIISEQGSNVSPGTAILRIVSLRNMYIEAEVPERYLPNVKKGTQVIADFPVLGEKVETEVRQASNYINPGNRSFRIEVGVPNKNGSIKPNLTAKMNINDYTNEKAILVPQSVISENAEGDQYVYVASAIDENGEAEVHRSIIETGKTQEDLVEVLSGIKEGDQIIKEGARSVQEGQKVKILKR
ncbi:efflux RND transporter periplasmic adaptor subunit [Galbibacter sp. EGI 63066]|uniref:efflux RND transporter periplasmic adaptor subunit n=1 Tax=Galbibacter sp. EGI 63066 TaxID=2993559 RepID=UPI0022492DFA|nr:efflux RND transporter periplasmic adaptor subunit [Galbibacter sp. EGI 63066]MCX2678872.1 efflux RND transporter periplasmic adaptor subunit [Galbibacter sp. EGI 63066]